jgi:DNA polymerase sigma
LPHLEELPELTPKWVDVLNNLCNHVMSENSQTREEEKVRNDLLQTIRSIVSQKYPKAKLHLFGSSNNGFAMKKSDLDICMTLDDDLNKFEDVRFDMKNRFKH